MMLPAPLRSLVSALGTMTALPIPGLRSAILDEKDFRRSTAWYAIIGMLIGLLAAAVGTLAETVGLSNAVQAFLVLAVPLLATRFFHIDGLCDVLDGFLAGKPAERTLEIMKDSRIGAFALGGAALHLLGRFVFLTEWAGNGWPWWALAGFFALSRTSAVFLAAVSPPASSGGLGNLLASKIPAGALIFCLLTGIACSMASVYIGFSNRIVISAVMTSIGALTMFVISLLMRAWAIRRIGGVNGDVLGAQIELSESISLVVVLTAFQTAHGVGGIS